MGWSVSSPLRTGSVTGVGTTELITVSPGFLPTLMIVQQDVPTTLLPHGQTIGFPFPPLLPPTRSIQPMMIQQEEGIEQFEITQPFGLNWRIKAVPVPPAGKSGQIMVTQQDVHTSHLQVTQPTGLEFNLGPGFLLDIITARAAFGMRKLRADYSGNCVRLRRSSDNAESDFGFVSNLHLDTIAIDSFIGGSTGFLTTWYDQSGNGFDITQTTASQQPEYVPSVQNGRSIARFSDSNDTVMSNTSFSATQPFEMITNLSAGTLALEIQQPIRGAPNTIFLGFDSTANEMSLRAGASGIISLSIPFSMKLINAIFDGASSLAFLNGVQSSTFDTSTNNWSELWVGNREALGRGLNGDIGSIIIVDSKLSDSDRISVQRNINDYWKIY